jgi:hypothetical protein
MSTNTIFFGSVDSLTIGNEYFIAFASDFKRDLSMLTRDN